MGDRDDMEGVKSKFRYSSRIMRAPRLILPHPSPRGEARQPSRHCTEWGHFPPLHRVGPLPAIAPSGATSRHCTEWGHFPPLHRVGPLPAIAPSGATSHHFPEAEPAIWRETLPAQISLFEYINEIPSSHHKILHRST